MSFGLFLLRIALGMIFIAHGGQKVFGWWGGAGIDKFIPMVEQMGFPSWMAYAAAYTELLGGAAIVVGLLTRVAGLGLASVMFVAAWKVHWINGFFLQDRGVEYNIALGAMALCLVFTGAGKISFDHAIMGKREESSTMASS